MDARVKPAHDAATIKRRNSPMSPDLVALLYLVAGVLFILALRGLSSPETSRQGNLFGMVGMAIAIVTTLASHPPAGLAAWALVIGGMAIGGGTGAVIARRVPMTAMPELVAACAVIAGIMDSRNGKASVAPALCKNVLRERCFFVMNMASPLINSARYRACASR